jgi:hypothetical protein
MKLNMRLSVLILILGTNKGEYIYTHIYIYIELGYGALQSTGVLCVLRSIMNFKSEMIDPNHLI